MELSLEDLLGDDNEKKVSNAPPPAADVIPPPASDLFSDVPDASPKSYTQGTVTSEGLYDTDPNKATWRVPATVWVATSFFAKANKVLGFLMILGGAAIIAGLEMIVDVMKYNTSGSISEVKLGIIVFYAALLLPGVFRVALGSLYSLAENKRSKLLTIIVCLVTLPLNLLFGASLLFNGNLNIEEPVELPANGETLVSNSSNIWFTFWGLICIVWAVCKFYMILRCVIPQKASNRFRSQ